MNLSPADRAKLLTQLDRLGNAVEELLLTGLTTASEATRQILGVTFQEASRLRLLRLSGTLRVANEELGRFTRNEAEFSQRRLMFFLNRAWLLGKGLARAIRENDEAELQKLLWIPPVERVGELAVVTIGVTKKIASGAFCAFEFRLRAVPSGQAFVWSTVFPVKAGVDVPAEGFLHIPQKQKFTASGFLDRKVVTLRQIGLSRDESGCGRIQLNDESTVEFGDDFKDWGQFISWSAESALERIRRHGPGPFDLDVELQEEIFLTDWQLGEAVPTDQGWDVFPVAHRGLAFDARVSQGIEGKATRKNLATLGTKRVLPKLFGLLHYESCRLVLQPLTTFTDDGPNYLTISDEAIDRKALLQTLKFT